MSVYIILIVTLIILLIAAPLLAPSHSSCRMDRFLISLIIHFISFSHSFSTGMDHFLVLLVSFNPPNPDFYKMTLILIS